MVSSWYLVFIIRTSQQKRDDVTTARLAHPG